MTRRRDLPPQLGEYFGVAAARASGTTARRLDAHDLDAPFRGARMLRQAHPKHDTYGDRDHDLRRLCAAYLTVAPTDANFSHVTAARL